MILTYGIFSISLLSTVTKEKMKALVKYNIEYLHVILPLAASEQDAKTACTVENFSSKRTLCTSSKPSS